MLPGPTAWIRQPGAHASATYPAGNFTDTVGALLLVGEAVCSAASGRSGMAQVPGRGSQPGGVFHLGPARNVKSC